MLLAAIIGQRCGTRIGCWGRRSSFKWTNGVVDLVFFYNCGLQITTAVHDGYIAVWHDIFVPS